MQRYTPKEIEQKWQKKWQDDRLFRVDEDSTKPKKYIIDMFPYPSGAAMHVGHMRNFTISDVISQYHRQKGYNVLHTMGWDTFGLPAENYAIKTGVAPQASIKKNIAYFKQQLGQLGMSYDWSREVNTSDPEYYRWTQWIFLQLFKQGLAYQKESAQWWCETDKTVLANEQVEGGNCWRCGNPVVKKLMKQWFFKITDYADELLEGIDDLDWPEKIKTMQRNWIGKSQGAELLFATIAGDIAVFTTRPDTVYGATFLVLAPEHTLVDSLTTGEQREAVASYKAEAQRKSDIARQENKEKTGVFTGNYATNPATGEQVPIWIADYVLPGYGTGAIMAVPAHDERDREFAEAFGLPIVQVVANYTEFGGDEAPREGLETRNKQVVDAIITDGKGNYLLQIEETDGVREVHFVGGGVDTGDESVEAALRREVLEEVGFSNIASVRQVAPFSAVHAFRRAKNRNQRTWGAFYEVEIDPAIQVESEIEQGMHTVEWVAKDEVAEKITWESHLEGWNAYLNERVIDSEVREGLLVNSEEFDGLHTAEARERIIENLESKGLGSVKTNYKMRDWLISRQRYWGAPIPIAYDKDGKAHAIPEDQLPVLLPETEDFAPDNSGRGPLDRDENWKKVIINGEEMTRETDTMDGYACSSWYFLRYADPRNNEQAWSPDKVNYWLPVDFYCGGDHAVSHLLYTRFWFHFFAKQGWVEQSRREPVGKLVYNGYILAEDGTKMSKSKGNTIDPSDIINQGYGADSLRLFEMFIAPYELHTNWNTNGVPGTYRFLQRAWTLTQEFLAAKDDASDAGHTELLRATHRTIQRVSSDLDDLGFNTAVAALMEYVNDLYKLKAAHGFGARDDWKFALTTLTQLLAPFAPHITEELWQLLDGEGSVHFAGWPVHDEQYLTTDTLTIAVQVTGKLRGTIEVATDAPREEVEAAALAHGNVAKFIGDQQPKRVIYVPGRLVNIVL
jgi:leucyl-tRNA synthetase